MTTFRWFTWLTLAVWFNFQCSDFKQILAYLITLFLVICVLFAEQLGDVCVKFQIVLHSQDRVFQNNIWDFKWEQIPQFQGSVWGYQKLILICHHLCKSFSSMSSHCYFLMVNYIYLQILQGKYLVYFVNICIGWCLILPI